MAGQRGPRRRLRRVRRDTALRGLLVAVLLLVTGLAAVGTGYFLATQLLAGLGAPAASQGAADGHQPEPAPGEPAAGDPSPEPSGETSPAGAGDDPAGDDNGAQGDAREEGDPGAEGDPGEDGDSLPADGPPIPVQAPAVPLYAVQVGSFSTRANAQQMAQELREAGLPAAVAAHDGYRVWVGLFDADAPARTMAAQVRQGGREAFVQPWALAVDGLLPHGEGAGQLAQLLTALPETTRQFAHVWTTRSMGGDQWHKAVEAVRERIISLQEQTLALTVPDQLDDLTGDLIQYVSRASALAASLRDLAQGDLPPAEAGPLMVEHMELAGEAARILKTVDQE